MVQIIYSVFEGAEPIYIQNFQCKTLEEAKKRLNDTYKNILSAEDVSNIKYDGKELEFVNENVETHQMVIIEN